VLIVDAHPLLRAGVRRLLETDRKVRVVGEAETIDEAVEACRSTRLDVILVDLDEASPETIDGIRRIRHEHPEAALVVVARRDDDEELYREILAGAAGRISESAAPQDLVNMVLEAAQGGEPIHQTLADHPEVARRVLEAYAHMNARALLLPHREPKLSDRELAILGYAAEGMTNYQIGREMNLSEHTIKSAISQLLGRLGLRHRTEAVVFALRHGWISATPPSSSAADQGSGFVDLTGT
jgi:DNA-binding NarL/FixJ family response regulator